MLRLRLPGVATLGGEPEAGRARVQPARAPHLAVAFGVLLLVGLLASSQGSAPIPPLSAFKILASRLPGVEIAQTWPQTWDTILFQLRLPRIVLAGIVGCGLAVSGATYQGLFRNPLADPYLIGVASGAGLGATIVLVAGVPLYFLGISLVPIAAFAGALAAVAVAYLVARRAEGLPLTTLILAGVAVAALAGSVTSLLLLRSDPDVRPVLSWLLGGFLSARWKYSVMVLPYLLPGLAVILAHARLLNVLQLDEGHARQLGVSVERTKLLLIAAASLSTAAVVSFSGLIPFVGIVAPHAVRLVWGTNYRFLLPMSAIVGATFLIIADLLARTIGGSAELPVGIVTSFAGAPFFLFLLRRRRAVFA